MPFFKKVNILNNTLFKNTKEVHFLKETIKDLSFEVPELKNKLKEVWFKDCHIENLTFKNMGVLRVVLENTCVDGLEIHGSMIEIVAKNSDIKDIRINSKDYTFIDDGNNTVGYFTVNYNLIPRETINAPFMIK